MTLDHIAALVRPDTVYLRLPRSWKGPLYEELRQHQEAHPEEDVFPPWTSGPLLDRGVSQWVVRGVPVVFADLPEAAAMDRDTVVALAEQHIDYLRRRA